MARNMTDSPIADGDQSTLDFIVTTWKNVLQRDVDPEDDFFSIGGNSMLLMAIIEALHQQFSLRISLENLVDGITPARLAELIDE